MLRPLLCSRTIARLRFCPIDKTRFRDTVKGRLVSRSPTMFDQFCPYCGASVQATDTSCPYCRKALSTSPPASKTTQSSFGIDPDTIRRKQNLFLWLMLIVFVWGGINITIASIALDIAREENPEAVFRDIRFNRIEIQSKKYQTLQTILQISVLLGNFLQVYMFGIWFQYIRSMGYSRLGAIGHLLLLFVPLVNLIVFFVMLRKGRVLIARYSQPEE